MNEVPDYLQDTDAPEVELIRQGFARRFVADEPRLAESVELYASLGFEVRLRRLGREELEGPDCAACLKAAPARFRVIYTRPKA
jgi:hypothetical protein